MSMEPIGHHGTSEPVCPWCGFRDAKKSSTGIWTCSSCRNPFWVKEEICFTTGRVE